MIMSKQDVTKEEEETWLKTHRVKTMNSDESNSELPRLCPRYFLLDICTEPT